MKVLQVNKFFWQAAGPERYMLELSAVLRQNGHEVLFFAMEHERNLESDCRPFFVSEIKFRNTSLGYKARTAFRTVAKMIYSLESKSKMAALVKAKRPDLAHVHMIGRQISPSILPALRAAGVPVVQTLHNHEIVCPASHLYINHRHEICERCIGGHYYQAAMNRCLQQSLGPSLLASVAHYVHAWTRIYEKNVDMFICPSKFLARNMIRGGLPKERVRTLPNFIDLSAYTVSEDIGEYGVFLGRLSHEKGLLTLLKAARLAPKLPILIVGEGPFRGDLETFSREQAIRNVTFEGYKQGDELRAIIRGAAFVVLPSECYENCPMTIYEANALGRPTIASSIGGIPEILDDGETGLLFRPGDEQDLAEKMLRLHADKACCRRMGRQGRAKIELLCNSHFGNLMAIYEEARARHN